MGSLNNGQPITQDTRVTKHTGHCILVTDYSDDSEVSCNSLAEGGEGLNP